MRAIKISENNTAEPESGELSLLFDISRAFNKHTELRLACASVLSLLESAGLSRGMVTFLDRSSGLLRIEEALGLSGGEKKATFRLGEGIIGRVFETGIAAAQDHKNYSFFCVPISRGGNVIGTLSVERHVIKGRSETLLIPSGHTQVLGFLEKVSSIISDAVRLREQIKINNIQLSESDGRVSESVEPAAGVIPGAEGNIIGTDNAIKNVLEMLRQVASSDATVLITGESGTGKELAAVELHRLSKRAAFPLVKINCVTLPESIIESELFGHEKGAFAGAIQRHKGRFEQAQGATIFLDEIGELPLQVQVKLLRVLQDRELERVGGTKTIKVDVRLIAATNRNLEEDVKAGRFREDLYYRLNIFPIHIPPLRERKSDIILLADHFTGKYARKNGKIIKRISTPAIDLLTSYSWPGNIRELENCIERAVILSTDMVIHSYNLPPSLQSAVSTNTEPETTLEAALSRLEKELIVEALKISGGNMAAAARRLGITERQIGLRVSHYKINWKLYRTKNR